MKKLAIVCAGTVLCAALLAGCGAAENQEPAISSDSTTITSQIQNQAGEMVESANAAPAGNSQTQSGDTTTGISAAEAEQIAREAADLTGGTVVQNHLDTDNGLQIYEIEIVQDGVEYSFEINATTGTILEQSRETQD